MELSNVRRYPRGHRMKQRLCIFLIIGVALLVFAPAAMFEFVGWDDNELITGNPHVAPPSLNGALAAWQTPHRHFYIPLTYNLWALLGSAGDPGGAQGALNPYLFHTANIALHLGSALLLYGLARRVVGSVWPAAACAILWAVHPLQVEPVAWATGMKDVLSGFLAILALYIYVVAASAPDGGRGRGWWYALAALCLGLASLAKPGVMMVPLVALAIDVGMLKRPWKRSLACVMPMLAAVVPSVVVTLLVQPTGGMYLCELWQRPFIAGHALATYLLKLVWPGTLAIDYGLSPQYVLQGHWVWFAWLVPVGVAVLAWRYRPLRREMLAALAIFVLVLAPVLGLVPFLFQFYSTVADRYAYLAMIGPGLALAYVFARIPQRYAVAGGVVILTALSIRSAVQVQTWRDTDTLLAHTIAVNPRSYLAYTNSGVELINRGARLVPQARSEADAAAGRAMMDAGEKSLKKALEIWPEYPSAWNSLSIYYLKTGRTDEALDARQKAADAYDRLPPALNEGSRMRVALAQACLKNGRHEQAIANLKAFLQRNPGDAEATALLQQATASPPGK